MTKLKIGVKAPEFSATDQNGKTVNLSDYLGQKVVLFFYPKDDTPGCTKEACNIRDNYATLTKGGIKVFGVSPDKELKHQKFIEKYDLPFDLLADTELDILKKYGVWGRKKFMGREYDGVLRTTFIIDEKGHILSIIDKVVTKDHSHQIMEAIKDALSNKTNTSI